MQSNSGLGTKCLTGAEDRDIALRWHMFSAKGAIHFSLGHRPRNLIARVNQR